MHKFYLLFLFLFIHYYTVGQCASNGISASQSCPGPLVCNFDEYCDTLPQIDNPAILPGCPGYALNNPNYIQFIAGSTDITFNIHPISCNGTTGGVIGMQGAIYDSTCTNAVATQCQCTTNDFQLSFSSFIVGQKYVVMVDGCSGDYCHYDLSLVSGSIQGPPIDDITNIVGSTNICPNSTSSYSITPIEGAEEYIWEIPSDASINGTSGPTVTLNSTGYNIDIQFGSTLPSSVCVTAQNSCNTSNQVCIDIEESGSDTTFLPTDFLCAGSCTTWINGNNICESGTYTHTLSSSQGCDSTIVQQIVVHDSILSNLGTISVCETDSIFVGNTYFNQNGTYQVVIPAQSIPACDSIINFSIETYALTVTPVITGNPCTQSDQTICLDIDGGSAPFSFNWNGGTSTDSCLTTSTGIQYFTVEEGNGCSYSDSVQVPGANLSSIEIITEQSITCNNFCDGQLSVEMGNAGSYTYNWNNGATSSTVSNLCSNWYYVTATDGSGCSIVDSIYLPEPLPLEVTTSHTDLSCSQQGQACIENISGGTPNYSFIWINTNAADSCISNLDSGNYTVIVTDAQNCMDTTDVYVHAFTSTDSIYFTNITQASCYGSCNGTATINASAPVQSYNWSNGDNTATTSSLCAGINLVTVTLNSGCVLVDSVQIMEPAALSVLVDINNPSCNQSNGSICVTTGGGTPAYSYTWLTPNATDSCINNLDTGNYTVVVTDAQNCMDTTDVYVHAFTSTDSIYFTSITPASCYGLCNGTATVNASAPVLSYHWSNGENIATATSLCAGINLVTVTLNSGCVLVDSVQITQPTALSVLVDINNPSCNQSNGSICVTTSGGTPAYSYVWLTPNATDSCISNLDTGNYTVVVTDAQNCMDTIDVYVHAFTNTDSIYFTNITPASCYGLCNGTATINASAPVQSYNWSNGDNTATTSSLCAGINLVTVTLNSGCVLVDSVQITESATLVSSLNIIHSNCSQSNGIVCANINGGSAPYTYAWSNGSDSSCADNLSEGTYYLQVTDNNNCNINDTIIIQNVIPNLDVALNIDEEIKCYGECSAIVSANITGGNNNYGILWSNGSDSSTINNLCADIYSITITDSNSCSLEDSIEVLQPSPLELTLNVLDESCENSCDGYVQVNVSGGSSPYAYNSSNDTNYTQNNTIDNLCNGSYWAQVIDSNQCIVSDTFSINYGNNSADATILTNSDTLCITANGISLLSVSSNGIWYGSNGIDTIGNIFYPSLAGPGNHTIYYHVDGICESTDSIVLHVISSNMASIMAVDPLCINSNPVHLEATPEGGNWWGNGVNNEGVFDPNIGAGTYTIGYGFEYCGDSAFIHIEVVDEEAIEFDASHICKNAEPIELPLTSNGSWIGQGITGNDVFYLNPNLLEIGDNYISYITPNSICADTQTFAIVMNNIPEIDIQYDQKTLCSPSSVAINNGSTTEIVDFYWIIDDTAIFQTSSIEHFFYEGYHSVSLTIMDSNKCSTSFSSDSAVYVSPNPVADFTYFMDPNKLNLLHVQDISTDAHAIEWSFGSRENNPSLQVYPEEVGETYDVCLYVSNIMGCLDTVCKAIELVNPIYFYIPQAFTPNQDDLNESFKPLLSRNEGIVNYGFRIFNRWGDLFWESDQLNGGWDGFEHPQGIYIWELYFEDEYTRTRYNETGFFSLIK